MNGLGLGGDTDRLERCVWDGRGKFGFDEGCGLVVAESRWRNGLVEWHNERERGLMNKAYLTIRKTLGTKRCPLDGAILLLYTVFRRLKGGRGRGLRMMLKRKASAT